ncbi:hypothetical protein IC582_014319 [Cucumis melo]
MDEYELASVLTAFLTSQRQLLLMLKWLQNETKRITHVPYETRNKIRQLAYFHMIHESDLVCRQSMRMDRRCFVILCHLLRNSAGLASIEIIDVEEMVVMFLYILTYDVKNREIQWEFMQSGEIVSWHINIVLLAILYDKLLKKPQLVTNKRTDPHWRWFEVRFSKQTTYSNVKR